MNIPDYLQKLVDETDSEEYAREQAKLRARYGIEATRPNENRGQQWIDYCEKQLLISIPWIEQLVKDKAPEDQIAKECDRVALCFMYLGEFDNAEVFATTQSTKSRVENLKLAVERMGTPSVHQHEKNGALAVVARSDLKEYLRLPKTGQIVKFGTCTVCKDVRIVDERVPHVAETRNPRMAGQLGRTGRRR